MIPLRLRLKGFLSYKHETVISFRGSRLWVIHGDNATGKSTLLDAMLFALFGEYRGKSAEPRHFIHHQAEGFEVEFDFAVGKDEYRVRRTLHKIRNAYRPTFQAFLLAHAEIPSHKGGSQPIVGTERKAELEKWVERILGLDKRAFTFAVLLQQGKSDALLTAKTPERHQLLTQIINLVPYERLRLRADAYHRRYDGDSNAYERQFARLELVSKDRLKELNEKIHQDREHQIAAKQKQTALVAWHAQAEQWKELMARQKHLARVLAECEVLLARRAQIEQAAQRFTLLKGTLPIVQALYEKRQVCVALQHDVAVLKEQYIEREQTHREGVETQQKLQQTLDVLRAKRDEIQESLRTIQQYLDELEPVKRQAATIENTRKQLREVEKKLSGFEPDLAAQQQHLEQLLTHAALVLSTLPKLQHLASTRVQWHAHTMQLQTIAHQQVQVEKELASCRSHLEEITHGDAELQSHMVQAQQEDTRAETHLMHIQQRKRNFQKIDGHVMCLYCGQPLTPEHLNAERKTVQEALQEATTHHRQTSQQVRYLREQQEQRRVQREQTEKTIALLVPKLRDSQQHQQDEALGKQRTETVVEGIFQALPAAFREHFRDQSGDALNCLQATYPTMEDFAVLEQEVEREKREKQHLEEVQGKLKKYTTLHDRRSFLHDELEHLEQTCPPEQQASIHQHSLSLRGDWQRTDTSLKEVQQQLSRYEKEQRALSDHVQERRQQLGQVGEQLAVKQQSLQHTTARADEIAAALSPEWQRQIADLSFPQLKGWQQELQSLQGAEAENQALIEAHRRYQDHQQRLLEVNHHCAAVPIEAQRPLEELETELSLANLHYQDAEKKVVLTEKEHVRVSELFEQRETLQTQLQAARRMAALYGELKKLLGPEYLQRYLLQKAEKGIVFYTNEFLDRVSGGTLRLELEDVAEQSVKGVKALELMAYNRAIDLEKPQPVDQLSWSQQFRISVCLALGIGRYAASHQHNESVMIDEGFGSLDVKGRRSMVQELLNLQNILECVLVVSHQPEIVVEFDNKYHISLVNGSSQVRLE